MTFDKAAWQKEYRKRKKLEREQEQKQEEDPELSLEENTNIEERKEESQEEENKEVKESPKKVKEKIERPPARKKGKKGKLERIPLNPQAFSKMSVGIEKLTLQVHKDKELKQTEQEFIETSAEQLAELYEMPKLIVILQYGAAMVFPHVTRILKAQAEKMELENESKKLDLEEKKRKVEQGRQEVKPEQVYESVMSHGDKGN